MTKAQVKAHSGVLFVDPSSLKPWYEQVSGEKPQRKKSNGGTGLAQEYRAKGKLIYDTQRSLYQKMNNANNDMGWYSSISKTGTKKDQIAALALMISSCPAYHVDELVQLLRHLTKQSDNDSGSSAPFARREKLLEVLDILLELFLSDQKPAS
jgi:hypothetical protein